MQCCASTWSNASSASSSARRCQYPWCEPNRLICFLCEEQQIVEELNQEALCDPKSRRLANRRIHKRSRMPGGRCRCSLCSWKDKRLQFANDQKRAYHARAVCVADLDFSLYRKNEGPWRLKTLLKGIENRGCERIVEEDSDVDEVAEDESGSQRSEDGFTIFSLLSASNPSFLSVGEPEDGKMSADDAFSDRSVGSSAVVLSPATSMLCPTAPELPEDLPNLDVRSTISSFELVRRVSECHSAHSCDIQSQGTCVEDDNTSTSSWVVDVQ